MNFQRLRPLWKTSRSPHKNPLSFTPKPVTSTEAQRSGEIPIFCVCEANLYFSQPSIAASNVSGWSYMMKCRDPFTRSSVTCGIAA